MKYLTIAIPTYNHHKYLLNQINLISPQLTEEIDFLILDNKSHPSIKEYLHEENIHIDSLRIIENDKNIGGDANIFKCLLESLTDWVWVLSDNDYIMHDSLKNVLTKLKQNDDSIYISFGNKYEIKTQGFDEYCRNILYCNSFSISNCIFNISKLKDVFSFYNKFINTHQAQTLFVFKYLEQNPESKCMLTKDRIIESSLPATWPKNAFILDTLYVYDAFEGRNRSYFIKHVGPHILAMQIALLPIARSYENMSLKDYLELFILLKKKSSFKQIFSKRIIKPIIYYILCLISPSIFRFVRKQANKEDHVFSNLSQNKKWDY